MGSSVGSALAAGLSGRLSGFAEGGIPDGSQPVVLAGEAGPEAVPVAETWPRWPAGGPDDRPCISQFGFIRHRGRQPACYHPASRPPSDGLLTSDIEDTISTPSQTIR